MTRRLPTRFVPSLLLVLALASAGGPAFLASRVDPPGNDLALHGVMIEGATEALREDGWTTFQDPWLPAPNGGYAIFHSYPHLVEQWLAVSSVVTGIDPWQMLGLGAFLAILALPVFAFLGGRILGLTPLASAVAAIFVATMRSADSYAHGTLSYGFESHGLFGQLCGMAFASLAFASWYAASSRDGLGVGSLSPLARGAMAALLVGIVLRIHYPTAWVLVLVTGSAVAGGGPLRELPGRLQRFGLIGAGGGFLAAGFLVPFIRDLDGVVVVTLEHAWKLRSIGVVAVLQRLATGEYFDGVAHVPWTPLFGGALVFAAVRSFGRARSAPLACGLLTGAVVAVLLLFGRETWGDWVDRIPVVGRFHDHRYVLGLMLLGPFVVAEGLEAAWIASPARVRRVGTLLVGAMILLAVGVHGMATWADGAVWRSEWVRFVALRAGTETMIQRSLDEPDERVALGVRDGDQGGTTLLWWLRRQGVNTAGRPLHQFAAVRELSILWELWASDEDGGRRRPIEPCDLRALGISRLIVPRGTDRDPLGYPWTLSPLDLADGDWTLLEAPREPGVHQDLALVRSDLLVRADRLDMDGFSLAWFLAGLHCASQYPSLDVGLGVPPDPGNYLREIHIDARDPAALKHLPRTTPGALGTFESVKDGPRPRERIIRVRVLSEGAWLRVGSSWHTGWRATVDGRDQPTTMLTPGQLGLPLSPGLHEVAVWWHVPAWRGWWAAINVLLYLLGIVWIGRETWVAVRRQPPPRTLNSEL